MKAFIALVLAMLGYLSFCSVASAAAPDTDRIVVMISVDGLAHYYIDDPKAEMPTIRQLAAEGARAQMMKCSMPTVTWPNHTTLVTGVSPARHGVIGNNYLDRATGKIVTLITDPVFDKDQIVKSPTIYDVAKQNGLMTAAIIWPASRGAKTLDWTVPDVFTDVLFQTYGTPSLLAEFKESGIPYEKQGEWCKTGNGVERDKMYVRMLNHVIRTHRPNLALLHLVEVDHVEHAHGPQSPEAYEAVKFADHCVNDVWEELKKSFPAKATLIVTADHGFFPYRQEIQPNVLLKQKGLLDFKGVRIIGGQVRAVSQGGACFIYIMDPKNRESLLAQVASLFAGVEGMDRVLTPKDFKDFGLADPQQNPQMADLVLCAKSGYSFSDTALGETVVTKESETTKGTHGYDPNQPGMHATFVAWGKGIKVGSHVGTIDNRDVAPTIAALLGIEMKNVEGTVVEGILAK